VFYPLRKAKDLQIYFDTNLQLVNRRAKKIKKMCRVTVGTMTFLQAESRKEEIQGIKDRMMMINFTM
jgi:hypothetical protein